MSIFAKDCPVCAASHPIHAVRCGCGYCFDPNKLDGVTQELEVISQEEGLYRDYLAARVDQSESAWQMARVTAAREPGDRVKAAEALLAEQNAMAARAEFDAQVERTRAVKNRIQVLRTSRRNRRVAAASATAPRPAPAAVREVIAPPRPSAIVPPPAAARVAPTTPAPVSKPVSSTRPALAPIPQSKGTYRSVVPSPGPTHVNNVRPVPPVARPQTAHAAPKPVPSPQPATAPIVAAKPTPSFRSNQAAKANRAVAASESSMQECPNCSGKVPRNVGRCRCGYELPLTASQIPSLSMSAEDRAALLAALSPPAPKPHR